MDEKENLCLELSRKNEDLIFNRENLQKTITILEEKLKNINKESTLKGIYLTPEKSKSRIIVAAKAEYEN